MNVDPYCIMITFYDDWEGRREKEVKLFLFLVSSRIFIWSKICVFALNKKR